MKNYTVAAQVDILKAAKLYMTGTGTQAVPSMQFSYDVRSDRRARNCRKKTKKPIDKRQSIGYNDVPYCGSMPF